jgi:hypothetical protein
MEQKILNKKRGKRNQSTATVSIGSAKKKQILAALVQARQMTRELELARIIDPRSMYEQVTL